MDLNELEKRITNIENILGISDEPIKESVV
jgi:hypothetical protein